MLMWLAGPYLASFVTSPATWITSFIQWGVYLVTTLQAIAHASSVMVRVMPSFLSPFVLMVLVSTLAGIGLLWTVSIWRFALRAAPRGV